MSKYAFCLCSICNQKKSLCVFGKPLQHDFTWGSLVKGVSHSNEQNKILVDFDLVNVNTKTIVNTKYPVLQIETWNSLCDLYQIEESNLKPNGCAGIH